MNCVQCVWFNGQFENMSQTHVEKRIRCNLKLILDRLELFEAMPRLDSC